MNANNPAQFIAHLGAAEDAFPVSPDNAVDFAVPARGLYIGGLGDVTLVTLGGNVVTFTAVPAGSTLWVKCRRVNATATTATLIVALV